MISSMINNLSIRVKIRGLVLFSALLALGLCCATFITNHYHFASQAKTQQLESLAEVLGANSSAAVVFDDSEAADQLLLSLNKQPMVSAAWIHNLDREIFSRYVTADGEEDPPFLEEGVHFLDDSLIVSRNIIDESNEYVGSISLKASLSVVNDELSSYLVSITVVIVISLVATLLLALPLEHSLTSPILALADVVKTVGEKDDYSLRVDYVHSDNEIGVLCREFNRMLTRVEDSEHELQAAHASLEIRVFERTLELSKVNESLAGEIEERERAERELEQTHRELVDVARQAGMAEIATGVLHNVGNVLNSVSTSVTVIEDTMMSPKRKHLDRVLELLEEHEHDLAEFLTTDEKGKNVPKFLMKIVEAVANDDREIIQETRELRDNISHITAIISTQQSIACTKQLLESCDVSGLIRDALKLNSASFQKHSVDVTQDLQPIPDALLDKHRVLQIVVNLIKNAREALQDNAGEKTIAIRTSIKNDQVVIEVQDNGIGISKEGLVKVFNHGYSTKKNGHGFGLHSCANAAQAMGGKLTVSSDGKMCGATFRLSLPYQMANEPKTLNYEMTMS